MSGNENLSSTMRIDITSQLESVRGAPILSDPSLKKMKPPQAVRVSSSKQRTGKIGSIDFRELFQNMYDAAVIAGMDGAMVAINERAEKFFKTNNESLIGENIISLLVGADDALFSMILSNLGQDRFTLIQAYCHRQDGSVFPAEVAASRLALGGTEFTLFFFRDVTLRHEAEEQLRTGFNAIQNSGNGIAVADIDWDVVYVNQAMRDLLDIPIPENLDALPGFKADSFLESTQAADIREAVLQGCSWSGELAVQTATQRNIVVNVSVAPNTNADDELTGMVISMIDITEQKKAEDQLTVYARELQRRNDQIEEDVQLAREIELALLQSDYPTMPPGSSEEESLVRFHHLYCPSWAVGGDFFSFIPISDDEVGMFLCDVMGHGTRAALVVATIRGLLEQLSDDAADPSTFVTKLNVAFMAIFSRMKDVIYATGVYCVLNVKTRDLCFVNAGQISPYVVRRSGGRIDELVKLGKPGQGVAIGLFPEAVFEAGHCQLEANDMLLLYTDGISEAYKGQVEFRESGAMVDVMMTYLRDSPEVFLDGLYRDCKTFMGSDMFEDDVCLLACEIK